MKKYSAVEHKDHFVIQYAGDKKPFKVAKGALSKDRLDKLLENASDVKYADGTNNVQDDPHAANVKAFFDKIYTDYKPKSENEAYQMSRATGKLQEYKDPKGVTHLIGAKKEKTPYVPEGYFNSSGWRNAMEELTEGLPPEEKAKRIKELEQQKEAIEAARYEKRKKVPSSDAMHGRIPSHADGGMIDDEEEMTPMEEVFGDEYPKPTLLAEGGRYRVVRTNERKGKTHKVIGPGGEVRYFGDPNLKNRPNNKEARAAYYARHKKNIANNPFFAAYSRATWNTGGVVEYADGIGAVDALPVDAVSSADEAPSLETPQALAMMDDEIGRPTTESFPASDAAQSRDQSLAPTITKGSKLGKFGGKDEITDQEIVDYAKKKEAELAPLPKDVFEQDVIEARPVPPEVLKKRQEAAQKGALKAPEFEPQRLRAAAYGKMRSAIKAQLLDAGVPEDRVDELASKAIQDLQVYNGERTLAEDSVESYRESGNLFKEITSDAFQDAINQGASVDEALGIISKMRRGGESLGKTGFDWGQEEGTSELDKLKKEAVELEAKRGSKAGMGFASAMEAEAPEAPTTTKKEGEAAVAQPLSGADKMPVPSGTLTTPSSAQALPGEALVPDAELEKMPEYQVALKAMTKAFPDKDDTTAKDFARKYALKARQSQVFDTRRAEITPEEAYAAYVDEQTKELQFQADLKLRADRAAEQLAKADRDLTERKARNFAMRTRVLENRRNALQEELRTTTIDPKRFFSTMSEGDKTDYRVLTILASLGGKGDELINNLVARDMNLQKEELGRKQNLLSSYIQEGNELEDAYKLAAADQKEVYATKLAALEAQISDPMKKSALRQTIAKIRAENVKTFLDVAKKATEVEFQDEEIQNRIAHRSATDMIGLMNAAYKVRKEARLARTDPLAAAKFNLAVERENRLRRKEARDLVAAQGSDDQQRLMAGEAVTGAQMRNVSPEVLKDWAVPMYDYRTGKPTGYYKAANSPEGKKKLQQFDVISKDFIKSLDSLEALLPGSKGAMGMAGYSETASPKEFTQSKILQKDLVTALGGMADLGVLQASDVEFLLSILPNLTTYERYDVKAPAFTTFRQMLLGKLENRRNEYLASGDVVPSGTAPIAAPFTPSPAPVVTPLTPASLGAPPKPVAAPVPVPKAPPSPVPGAGPKRKRTAR